MKALYYGDNLRVLREEIKDESVDLIYLDPPFNSNATYNVLFKSPEGAGSQAQIEAFEDAWHWSNEAEQAFDEVMTSGNTDVADMLNAMRAFLKENDVMAYLTMMAVRLLELHRVLKNTGSIYLHCDPTAGHYLKILLDAIFGARNFRNEVIWKRTSSSNNPGRWGPVHDDIFFYSKTNEFTWNKVFQVHDAEYVAGKYKYDDARGRYRLSDLTAAGTRAGHSGQPWRGFDPNRTGRHWGVPRAIIEEFVDPTGMTTQQKLDVLDEKGFIYWTPGRSGKPGFPQLKRYLTEGTTIQDVITDIAPINSMAKERLGFPTQKPVELLERIICASSNPGEAILDPFCGCGTAVHAAEKLGRDWIGIDVTHLAISLIEKRLSDAFPGIKYEVHGTPKDLGGAIALADLDKFQFEWWAVSLVGAVPFGGKKKGADSGIDGIIYCKPDGKKTERVIVSVKGGKNVNVAMVRDLKGVLDREKAPFGILVTLHPPTKPMTAEAASAGVVDTAWGKVPRLQILTVEELLGGKKANVPGLDPTLGFKKAAKEVADDQGKLL
ncbi:MAG: site-specific DNA-methyltransferase [Rhodospirillales bacterium CG15_BIG_FIL_POST_REV_8_21_14_020_66_15]|nr:MAG: site-specific DNA-methyltransferase [Rhodospirillales bacterium CG15_BIG_FIL_POST_REV_8_21_14_020_66_15]